MFLMKDTEEKVEKLPEKENVNGQCCFSLLLALDYVFGSRSVYLKKK